MANSEFEGDRKHKPEKTNMDERSCALRSYPADRQASDSHNEQRADNDADLASPKVSNTGCEKDCSQGAVDEFNRDQDEPCAERPHRDFHVLSLAQP